MTLFRAICRPFPFPVLQAEIPLQKHSTCSIGQVCNLQTKIVLMRNVNVVRLPDAEKAIIEPGKLAGYILSSTHPVGRFKAAVFQKLGYSSENWEEFEHNLRKLVLTQAALKVGESQYGKKYLVKGPFTGTSGNTKQIVTIWVILEGESTPRFVTAYPGEL
ncbi:MAG: hypothetical protein HYX91_04000 [Chloroflexi bacterium]|nr:hypothetical protein [Chloroflexota bacterium]